jgi:hypothetical protein
MLILKKFYILRFVFITDRLIHELLDNVYLQYWL